MKYVQKSNKQLRVEDVQLDAYLKLRYIEIDKVTGKPVTSVPLSVTNFEIENAALKEQNDALLEELALLKAATKGESETSIFACDHCGKEYKTSKGLADHIGKEHPDAGDQPEK